MRHARTFRLASLVTVVTVTVAACAGGAGGSGGGNEGSTAAPGTSVGTDVEDEALTLVDVCPQVEAALPGGMLPSKGRWIDFVADLTNLSLRSDRETQNALELVSRPVIASLGKKRSGIEALDAADRIDAGLNAFAERCKAAGSTALQ